MESQDHFQRGESLYKQQDYKAAIVAFSNAAAADTSNAEIYYMRAMSFYHDGNIPESLEDMSLAVKHDPENPFRYATRAYIRSRSGDTQGGIDDYKKALELDPADAIAENNLGMLEEQLGYEESAKARFKKADAMIQEEEFDKFFQKNPEAEAQESTVSLKEEETTPNDDGSFSNVIGKVFTDKSTRREFWSFVRKGFKL